MHYFCEKATTNEYTFMCLNYTGSGRQPQLTMFINMQCDKRNDKLCATLILFLGFLSYAVVSFNLAINSTCHQSCAVIIINGLFLTAKESTSHESCVIVTEHFRTTSRSRLYVSDHHFIFIINENPLDLSSLKYFAICVLINFNLKYLDYIRNR